MRNRSLRTALLSLVWLLVGCDPAGVGGGSDAGGDGGGDAGSRSPLDATVLDAGPPSLGSDGGIVPRDTGLGSDWWPDRDSDEVGSDHTPAGSQILDLHTEHVTPYGAWFSYTAIEDPTYRWDTLLCWSTDETELDTAAGVDAANARGDCVFQQVRAHTGFAIEDPFIVTTMEPGTVYYARIGVLHWEGSVAGQHLSNVVRFETRPDPRVTLPTRHPRVVATPALLETLRARYEANDPRTRLWVERMSGRALRAAEDPESIYLPGGYGASVGLLWHTTGDERYLSAARFLLFEYLVPYYEDNELSANQYRWAGQTLAATADLIWDELSTAEKQRVVDAMLPEDEQDENVDPRFQDTDQYVANTHIQLAHSLAVLNSPELSASSLERMDAVFDRALRRWYGALQVKMRRAGRIHGLSGGTMDDGTDYARGTQSHWLETLWALDNVGMSQADYAEWVWNNVRTHNLYAVVPDGSGVVTFGDIEDDSILPDGSHSIDEGWTSAALKMGLLDRWGRTLEAGYTRASLLTRSPTDSHFADWALLTDHAGLITEDPTSLPTAFVASGFGQVFDRTGWGPEDSFLYFLSGWRGVDHNQPDVGHFSLWSGGAWVTHELPSYDLVAENHNIVLVGEAGQFGLSSQGSSRIVRVESTADHLFVLADTTEAYMDVSDHLFPFTSVLRALYWDKRTDRVIVYDRLAGEDLDTRQNVRGGMNSLFDEHRDGVTEMLMVVNGEGELELSDGAIGVAGVVAFDRATAELR